MAELSCFDSRSKVVAISRMIAVVQLGGLGLHPKASNMGSSAMNVVVHRSGIFGTSIFDRRQRYPVTEVLFPLNQKSDRKR